MFQDVREFEELRALTFRMPHNAHRKVLTISTLPVSWQVTTAGGSK